MCGNRVEELESRVQELEASVRGLTDELVECKVRLRELEDAESEDDLLAEHAEKRVSDGIDETDAGESESGAPDTPDDQTASTESPEGGAQDGSETDTENDHPDLSDGTEVVHAEEPTDDTSNTDDGESQDDTGTDIIVA